MRAAKQRLWALFISGTIGAIVATVTLVLLVTIKNFTWPVSSEDHQLGGGLAMILFGIIGSVPTGVLLALLIGGAYSFVQDVFRLGLGSDLLVALALAAFLSGAYVGLISPSNPSRLETIVILFAGGAAAAFRYRSAMNFSTAVCFRLKNSHS